jgi:hypothetical protein
LRRHNITKLYHFTDPENLPSIRQHGGLLSWYYCEQHNIRIPRPDESPTSWILDQEKGLQNFVRVSFVSDHPMMVAAERDGRLVRPVVLEIEPEVVYLLNSRYANQNAARNSVLTSNSFEYFSSIHFPLFNRRYYEISPEERNFYQAEVLVLEKIPIESILNINNI